jgi:hypothetical protein
MHPITTMTSPPAEPAAITLAEVLDELEDRGWTSSNPQTIRDLRRAGLDFGGTYYLQPDGIAHIWDPEGMVKSTAAQDAEGVSVDGLACETLAEAMAALDAD